MLAELEVRRATEQDLPALAEMLDRYFTEEAILHRDDPATLLAQVQSLALGWYVAELPQRIVGCVLGRMLPHMADSAECKRLYVSPEARGKGFATRLMTAPERAACDQGFTWMYLDSKDSFAVAMAMYTRRGYKECARYNDNTQPTFFFRKQLS